MKYQHIAEQLGEKGLCVWPNFLSENCLRETQNNFDEIQSAGGFSRAGTGQNSDNAVQKIRSDSTYWLDRETNSTAQTELWKKIDKLKQSFNRTLFLGITAFEGHYSSYSTGGFYQRHLDCFRHDDTRIVSFVLYLNQNWQKSDGGCLRIYKGNSHTDIEPRGGTMVCFLSREAEHEVMKTHSARHSFTGWFKMSQR